MAENKKRKIIDTVIDLGCEIEALDRCPGYREMCWTGDSYESKFILKGLRDHFDTPWPEIAPLTTDFMIQCMDEANVEFAVLHGMYMDAKAPWYTKKNTSWKPLKYVCPPEYVKEVRDRYPKRFKAVAGINPLEPRHILLDKIKMYIEEWGFAGIKLFPFGGWYPSDKELLYPVYELCTDLDAVVCITSSQIGFYGTRLRPAHVLQIDDIAQDFPDMKIQIVCGGERTMWHNEAVAICMHSRNVNMDTAPATPTLPTGYAKVPSDLLYAQDLASDHIMWGSEFPYSFPLQEAIDALENTEGLTEEFKNKLFYENAKKFYGF